MSFILFSFSFIIDIIFFATNNGSLWQLYYYYYYLFIFLTYENGIQPKRTPHSHGLIKINLSGFLVESYHVTSCAFPALILLHLIFFLKSSFSAPPMVALHTSHMVLITRGELKANRALLDCWESQILKVITFWGHKLARLKFLWVLIFVLFSFI